MYDDRQKPISKKNKHRKKREQQKKSEEQELDAAQTGDIKEVMDDDVIDSWEDIQVKFF